MPTINLLLYVLFAVTALSVLLSVIAWFILASIGSKLSILERETEKRSQEFDVFRKERATTPDTTPTVAVIEETDTSTPLPSISEPVGTGIEDTIQIFRNVRSSYKEPETGDTGTNGSTAPSNDGREITAPAVVPAEMQQDTIQEVPRSSIIHEEVMAPPVMPAAVPKAVFTAPPRQPVDREIVVRLYSDATKDADFQTLWQTIATILKTNSRPGIAIDLSEINFLYEKEMDYLVKINYLITKQGGILSLTHCDKDLLSLLNRKEHLGSIIKL